MENAVQVLVDPLERSCDIVPGTLLRQHLQRRQENSVLKRSQHWIPRKKRKTSSDTSNSDFYRENTGSVWGLSGCMYNISMYIYIYVRIYCIYVCIYLFMYI